MLRWDRFDILIRMNTNLVTVPHIQNKILTIREQQVMLDRDLAELYGVETKRLNEQVRRNIERFPEEFRLKLTKEELAYSLRSQFATLKSGRGAHSKYATYAFTEQGVAMLSTVLKSEIAVQMSIRIMNAFVAMRRFIVSNEKLFHRVDVLENKVDEIFDKLGKGELQPKQGIFFDGQIFDAFLFVTKLLKSATHSITLIDNYIDETTLQLFSVCRKSVPVSIYTRKISANINLAISKFNSQYAQVTLKLFSQSHDRFLIIDGTVYHFGASLKDLGKKWFAFSKMTLSASEIESKLQ